MKIVIALGVAATLAGCGVETATTAARVAAMKKQELQDGQRTMQQAQQKIDGAMLQMQERTADADK
jgi:hypothetical protein